MGPWAEDAVRLPFANSAPLSRTNLYTNDQMQEARRTLIALCTQIDHRIHYLTGTLRLECILDDPIILFTSERGDVLDNHTMTAKRIVYESSANIPIGERRRSFAGQLFAEPSRHELLRIRSEPRYTAFGASKGDPLPVPSRLIRGMRRVSQQFRNFLQSGNARRRCSSGDWELSN